MTVIGGYNNSFTNCDFANSGGDGLLIQGGYHTSVVGCAAAGNSQTTSGAKHGFEVAAGVTYFTFVGCVASNDWNVGGAQGYGILINGSGGTCDHYVIQGCLFHNNLTGNLGDFGTGTDKFVSNNVTT
jgi:hypothetical protein